MLIRNTQHNIYKYDFMSALFKKAPVAEEELDKARVCGRWDQVLSLEQRYKSKFNSCVYSV